jgi:hypothetical protein
VVERAALGGHPGLPADGLGEGPRSHRVLLNSPVSTLPQCPERFGVPVTRIAQANSPVQKYLFGATPGFPDTELFHLDVPGQAAPCGVPGDLPSPSCSRRSAAYRFAEKLLQRMAVRYAGTPYILSYMNGIYLGYRVVRV